MRQIMWRCANCKSEIDDNYLHCWHCGTKHFQDPTKQQASVKQAAVPEFASYEKLAKVPKSAGWLWRRGPAARILGTLLALLFVGLLKVLDSPFIRAYGIYIVVVFAVCALVVILWRYFHRDSTEGVGIKLN